jgi:predicted secreted protein
MRLSLTTVIAIYFVTWWIALFMVLPWSARPQREDEVPLGTDPGAPSRFRFGFTLLMTTIVSAALFGIVYAIFASGLLSYDMLIRLYPV